MHFLSFGPFEPMALQRAATSILERGPIAGTDKTGRDKFNSLLSVELALISKKLKNGTYRFTRYRQSLRGRGPGREPREICIPTYRDRVALAAILQALEGHLSKDIDRDIPNAKIRRIAKYLRDNQGDLEFARIDVRNFFDSIDHDLLFEKLQSRGVPAALQELVKRAITQTTQQNTARKTGLPQGLSISPILANAFVREFFQATEDHLLVRHLDDVLLLGPSAASQVSAMTSALGSLKLSSNPDKLTTGKVDSGDFTFLGYRFLRGGVGVAAVNCQRFIRVIERIIGQHVAKTPPYFRRNYNETQLDNILTTRISKKISGAKYKNHRYGWIVYYSASNDAAQLRWLDRVIASILRRRGLSHLIPRVSRLYETWLSLRQSTKHGSVTDYDEIQSHALRLEHLEKLGEVDNNANLSEERVAALFESVRNAELRDLERDIGLVS